MSTSMYVFILEFPRERVPVVLAPLLYHGVEDLPSTKLNPDTVEMSTAMVSDSATVFVSVTVLEHRCFG